MAQLQTQEITINGVQQSLVAATAGGDTFTPDERTFFAVKNGDAAAHTVTVAAQASAFGEKVGNAVVNVPAGETVLIGPFPRAGFSDTTGEADVTYDAVASVTVGAFRI